MSSLSRVYVYHEQMGYRFGSGTLKELSGQLVFAKALTEQVNLRPAQIAAKVPQQIARRALLKLGQRIMETPCAIYTRLNEAHRSSEHLFPIPK